MKELMDSVHQHIDNASDRLAQGEMVSLAGLDDAINILCKKVEALSPDEGKTFTPALDELYKKLDALQMQMVDAKKKIEDEISNLNVRQKAAKAYGDKK